MTLKNRGAAVVIEEKELTGDLLYKTVFELLEDRNKTERMGNAAKKDAYLDANKRIYEAITALL